jgi:predicted DNA binding CopG/RHH family protein
MSPVKNTSSARYLPYQCYTSFIFKEDFDILDCCLLKTR